jgi:nicotinamidase-related amidase
MRKLLCSWLVMSLFAPAFAQQKTAVLVIDIQKFYFPGGSIPLVEPERAAANAAQVIEHARTGRLPVIYVQHDAPKGMEISDIVKPRAGESVFVKQEINGFNGTGLLGHLKNLGVDTLLICGMQTHMCVEAAVRAAHDLGFKVILVHDACATRDLSFGGRTVSAADVQTAVLAALKAYATIVSTEDWIKQGR